MNGKNAAPIRSTPTRQYVIFTRTPLHVGAGQSVGYVDLPVQREAHTGIPVIPGSSLKGVLRDLCVDETLRWQLFGHEFGTQDKEKFRAGALLLGEARVLCFPVRSVAESFAWITCPLVLRRAVRDGLLPPSLRDKIPAIPERLSPEKGDDLLPAAIAEQSKIVLRDGGHPLVVLEEYEFRARNSPGVTELEAGLRDLLQDDVWQALPGRLAVIPDGMFSFFVRTGCPIEQHVKINDETGTAEEHALFNQETVPSETLFYGLIAAQDTGRDGQDPITAEEALKKLAGILGGQSPHGGDPEEAEVLLQVGGGETTGLGWCTFRLLSGKGGRP